MKYLLFVFLLISFPAQAYDTYERSCNHNWRTVANIKGNTVKSVYRLTDQDLRFVEGAYDRIQESFFVLQSASPTQCKQSRVRILIVSEESLDSRMCFPDEDDYAYKNEIVFGRYFKRESTLYIVVPNLYLHPLWKSYFAHELAHHLFYDCGQTFVSSQEEHLYVNNFLTKAGYPLP